MNVYSRAYIDSLYEDYLQDPNSLSADWQQFFKDFNPDDEFNAAVGPAEPEIALNPDIQKSFSQLQDRVDQLVRGFRVRGHLEANLDPLGRPRPTNRELNPESYGLMPDDLNKTFSARTVDGQNFKTLEELVTQMRSTYCRSIGVQFMHIDDRSRERMGSEASGKFAKTASI